MSCPQEKASILLIDTSYVVFARYYSALTWYKASINRNPDVTTLFESPVFQNKFSDLFNSSINRVIDAHCDSDTIVIFARDCNRNSVWRRAHFEGYKESRTQNGNFNSEAFSHAYNEVIPRRLRSSGGSVIGSAGAEGDDVIGVIHAHLRDAGSTEIVVILTNDNDCIQLSDERTRVINLLQQDVGQRRGSLTPSQYLRYRILSGDRSDNIPSIVPRCGPKTATRLVTEHDEQALRRIYGDKSYDRNDLLMNMRNVPEDIHRDIIRQFVALLPPSTAAGASAAYDA
nr:5'-3' exonuclease [Oceanusvirus sp.]